MKLFRALFSIVITLVLIWTLQTKFGDVPPIGKFLNPATGFWQNAESKNLLKTENLKLPGLQSEVVIQYDEHMIPHIFAKNEHDLYYAQGYVTARDRLWQMDIQTRSAAGRLAEIAGPKAIEIDRYHRRMGMSYGAENTLKGMIKDPVMSAVVSAYTDGVNTYINHLTVRDYPIEFKLLDYKPETWKPINSAYLLKLMSETLAGGSSQFAMTNTLKRFGAGITNNLFPDYSMHEEPIIPKGTSWDFKPVPLPKASAGFIASMTDSISTVQKVEGIGSNNWAISGNKTASGYPILANDPHLNLTFPSIWYQIQLSAPGVNVYGVSLPGSPCIIIGYNQHISWGATNVDADVLDWYQIRFKDNSKTEYWYNGHWNKITRRIEAIKVKGGKTIYDTVLYTHHGPVVYEAASKKPKDYKENIPIGDALRWIAHDESNDIKTFYLLNRGKNYDDYRNALKYYTAPAQNFVFASNDKDIAITPNGKFPLKFRDQGKYILDGTDPANDWKGWVPFEHNPTVKNPNRGFVSSANQSSTDPTYPYYINWKFGPYERGKRINDRLAAMNKATVDSIRNLQTDTYSILAQDILPTMLKYLDSTKLNDQQKKALQLLYKWDKHFAANSIGASIFNAWWQSFYKLTWDDEFDKKEPLLAYPSRDRTEELLLKEPQSTWFDDKSTFKKETATDIINNSFIAAVNELAKINGQKIEKWEWGAVKQTSINHLANLPGFGTGVFPAGGYGSVVNAIWRGSGPSWRMVVQMGPVVKGYGIFPGGESGNPGSFYYDDMFKTWNNGKLNELLFLNSANENSKEIKTTTTLNPGR